MSIEVLTQGGGAGGESASIFVTGLSESDTVSATKDGKTVQGKWLSEVKEVSTQVPIMTSNTTPSGAASMKSEHGNGSYGDQFSAYRAFQGAPVNDVTAHGAQNDAQNWWIAYDFGFPVTVSSFDFAPQVESNYSTVFWKRFPAIVALQGSNDGADWNTIQEFNTENPGGTTAEFQIKTFTVDTSQTYSQYRLLWKTLTSDNDKFATCSYVQFYGTATKIRSGHAIPIKSYGTWTVTATNGEKTVTQDVLVDAAIEYEIEMGYKL